MRIVHLAAGAGGMYCGACARDIALARGMMQLGHDVEVTPLYTPLRFDGGAPLATTPVYLGGVNAYLQQHVGLLRHTPKALDRWLDHPRVLEWASGFAVRTTAQNLGPMIVSVLEGVNGRQAKELRRLIDHIVRGKRPDVISITNSLLTGVAPTLKDVLGVPIVCGLQGEDSFMGGVPEPHRSAAMARLRHNAQSIDLFVSPGNWYADEMAEFLAIPRERISVIPTGIDAVPFEPGAERPVDPFTILYLSVITPMKGLDLLVEAFERLVDSGRDVRLIVAGKTLNKGYWKAIDTAMARPALAGRVDDAGEVDHAEKVALMRRASVFCVPTRMPEARGVAYLEAMAAGVPVMAPASGCFPEMLALTGGGMLFEAGDAGELANTIADMMDDPDAADAMGRNGAVGVRAHFAASSMVDRTLKEYERLTISQPLAT